MTTAASTASVELRPKSLVWLERATSLRAIQAFAQSRSLLLGVDSREGDLDWLTPCLRRSKRRR